MFQIKQRYINVFLICTAIKILLIPTYLSTDFEVHRNWLAITNSLPISKWYIVDNSQWTLDYPPFFAWFEFILSQFASLFDANMLNIDNLEYKSQRTILFQRLTVILTDILFFVSSYLFANEFYGNNNSGNTKKSSYRILSKRVSSKHSFLNGVDDDEQEIDQQQNVWYYDSSFLTYLFTVLNPGLLIVDHIHFQYNGFLKGILMLSLYFMVKNQYLMGGIVFSVLLNFKHIYMYLAPAYFIYLLKYYCFDDKYRLQFKSFLKLGMSVIFVFAISFGPFIKMGQLGQVLSRLFPFGRGLSHAYWAPNFWSLYNFADRLLLFVGSKLLKWDISMEQGMLTSGLVGSDSQTHVILPKITPFITLILTCIALLPSVYGIIKSKSKQSFILGVCQACFTFYMFGWHVHEKAIIMITIPLGLLTMVSGDYAKEYFFLSTIGNYSLFPLLFTAQEIPLRILILSSYTAVLYNILSSNFGKSFQFKWYEKAYLWSIILLEIFNVVIHPLYLNERLPFISLMITSVFCAIGVHYSYLTILFNYNNNTNITKDKIK